MLLITKHPTTYIKDIMSNFICDNENTQLDKILEDMRFLSLYLYKVKYTVTSLKECIEYAGEDYCKSLRGRDFDDKRAYALGTLNKEKYFELINFYKGYNLL